jgi:hypothetical protein
MPSRQPVPLILDSGFCVTAPTSSICLLSRRCMCGCGALKKDVCTAKATEPVSCRVICMYGVSKGKRDFSDTSVLGKGQVGCW